MLQNLFHGLTALDSLQSVTYLIAGSLIGMFLGVIPGLGGAVVLSIILAFIYHISLTGAICLFLAVQAASYYSASVTSILLNTPAHPEAFAVTFDGFPMAQKGEPGRALGISAMSTCVGGLIGCAVLIGFIQIMDYLPLLFHPPEYVGLVLLALLLVGSLGTDAASKAVISAGIGLMISSIGEDPISGVLRYTFNAVSLYSGISLVALALGLFAIPQMVLIFGTATTIARQDMMGNDIEEATPVELGKGFSKQVLGGMIETLHHWVALIRSSLVGVITGVIPGIGGFAANFLSYGIAQQLSRRGDLFGTGIPEGIIAPEGSSLSKEAGGLVPLVGLGIPGGVGGALFLAALVIKNVTPGYGFEKKYPVLPYEMMWVIAISGVIGTLAGVLASPLLAKVTKVPGPLLVPIVMSISILGTFIADISFFSVIEVAVFGVVGLLLRRLRYSLASFAIGLVLGTTLEDNLYLTRSVYHGWTFLKLPFADALFILCIGVLVSKTLNLRRDKHKADSPITEEDPILRAYEERRRLLIQHPYPLLGFVMTTILFGFTTAFAVYGGTHYSLQSALMPVAASSVAAVATLWRLPAETMAYIQFRRLKKQLNQFAAPLAGTVGEETSERGAVEPIVDKSWKINGQYTRETVGLVWLGLLIALCWVFGFLIGVPVFAAAYGLLATGRVLSTWFGRIIFAACTAAAMYAVSYEMLKLLNITFKSVVTF